MSTKQVAGAGGGVSGCSGIRGRLPSHCQRKQSSKPACTHTHTHTSSCKHIQRPPSWPCEGPFLFQGKEKKKRKERTILVEKSLCSLGIPGGRMDDGMSQRKPKARVPPPLLPSVQCDQALPRCTCWAMKFPEVILSGHHLLVSHKGVCATAPMVSSKALGDLFRAI